MNKGTITKCTIKTTSAKGADTSICIRLDLNTKIGDKEYNICICDPLGKNLAYLIPMDAKYVFPQSPILFMTDVKLSFEFDETSINDYLNNKIDTIEILSIDYE